MQNGEVWSGMMCFDCVLCHQEFTHKEKFKRVHKGAKIFQMMVIYKKVIPFLQIIYLFKPYTVLVNYVPFLIMLFLVMK